LFKNPEVTPADQLDFKWADCDEEGLIKFMVTEKGFSEERVRNGIKRLQKQKGQSTQLRLDSFFKRVAPAADSVKPGAAKTADNAKRKGAASGSAAAKKAKSGGAGAPRPK
jgi:flap endonuclease-1